MRAYRELSQQEDGTDKDKIRTLRQNLKTVEQKIANIVNIIANTGSAALVTQLTQLEREKSCWMFRFRRRNEAPRKVN